MLQLLRLGYRSLARRRMLWAGISLTLSVALAATVLVFSVIDSFLLRPLPYGHADRLVLIYEASNRGGSQEESWASFGNAVQLFERAKSFSHIGLIRNQSYTIHGTLADEVAYVERVTPDIFPMLGAKPELGLVISPAVALRGGLHAVVLSHELWQRRFQGDPDILGRSVQFDNEKYAVVGVMPADFQAPNLSEGHPQAWMALLPEDYLRTDFRELRHRIMAELAPGVSLVQARLELDQIAAALRRDYPREDAHLRWASHSLRDELVGGFDRRLLLLQAAVFLLLAVACLNCACLLLAQGIERRREFAVRLALGASRGALLRQLVAESVWLALPAGALACLLVDWLAPWTSLLLPPDGWIRFLPLPKLDAAVAVAIFGLCLMIVLLFSLVPLLQTRNLNLEVALRAGGRQTGSHSGTKLTRWLLVGQVAIALALVLNAALMVRSYQNLETTDRGFPVDRVATFNLGLHHQGTLDLAGRLALADRLMEKIQQTPGVAAVGFGNYFFATAPFGYLRFVQENDGLDLATSPKSALLRVVSPGVKEVFGLKLIAGRWIAETDDAHHPPIAIISASLAEKFWPGQSPLGRRVTLQAIATTPVEIVGVASNIIGMGPQPAALDTIYLSAGQYLAAMPAANNLAVFVRSAGRPLNPQVWQRAVEATDSDLQFFQYTTAAEEYRRSSWQGRFVLVLIGIFAGLSFAMSFAGIYAMVSFTVSQRVREFGVRAALGATTRQVTLLVLGEGLRTATIGIGAGLAVAWVAAQSLRGMLYGVSPADLWTYLGTSLGMIIACSLAAVVPALRAARLNPLDALRAD